MSRAMRAVIGTGDSGLPSSSVSRSTALAVVEPDDDGPIDAKAMMQAIAMDIGKELVAYIEVMYPKAIETTPSTFKLSMRNHVYNDIMAAFEFRGDAVQLAQRLKTRKEFRREWVAAYRKIRRKEAR